MIARRGVASDRVVDTQLPQSSVYLFQPGATSSWTDVDAEFFGLSLDEIDALRAAVDFASRSKDDVSSAVAEQWKSFRRLRELIALALESDRTESARALGGR
ncbi:MAG: hypothetical protein HUK22_02145 [Thermoguttaceae bacterium]|nr:hypothetical protein [Thermoguttaceae bacterium]